MAHLKWLLAVAALGTAGEMYFAIVTPLHLTSCQAFAQSSSSYTDQGITFQGITDPTYNVTYGFVFPPLTETNETTEFIGEIVTPVSNQWIGVALGGQMADDLLLVLWPNGDEIMYSPRWATCV